MLPPIPTADLTADDVTALSERTRAIMLEALRDISRGPSARVVSPPPERVQEALVSPPPEPEQPKSESTAPGLGPVVEIEEAPVSAAGSNTNNDDSSTSDLGAAHVRQRTISVASSRGGETEEDEGMVLVGRP